MTGLLLLLQALALDRPARASVAPKGHLLAIARPATALRPAYTGLVHVGKELLQAYSVNSQRRGGAVFLGRRAFALLPPTPPKLYSSRTDRPLCTVPIPYDN